MRRACSLPCVLLALTFCVVLSSAHVSPALASELEPSWRASVDAAEATSVVYGRDGKTLLVSGFRGEVALWGVGDDKPRLRYPGAVAPLRAARFADGGRNVTALGLRDRKIWRWETATAAPLPPIDLSAVLTADDFPFRFDTDAAGVTGLIATPAALYRVALNGQGAPGRIAAPEAKPPFIDAALAPDGRSVCVIDGGNRIHCYNTGDGKLIASLSYELDANLVSITILPDGALAVGTAQGYIARWKSMKGDYIDTAGFDVPSPANAVAAFPSRLFFAAGRADGQINVYSPELSNRGPRIELLGAKGMVKMIAINAEGQLAAAVGKEIVVWEIGKELVRRGGKF